MTVREMLDAGRLESVEPDAESAEAAREESSQHLESARTIAESDPNGAYQLAYDAARKAVMASMRREGVRVRRGEGAHAIAAEYAGHQLDHDLGRRLDAMRRRRNRSEYGTAFFGREEVLEAVETAEALLAASRSEP